MSRKRKQRKQVKKRAKTQKKISHRTSSRTKDLVVQLKAVFPIDNLEDIAEDVVSQLVKDSKDKAKTFLDNQEQLLKALKANLGNRKFFIKIAGDIADALKVAKTDVVKYKSKVIGFICGSKNFLRNVKEELRDQADLD